jgi:hypothetical protein
MSSPRQEPLPTFWPRPGQTPVIDRDIFCPNCSYNLRGIQSKVCPECGKPIEMLTTTSPGLPWTRRRADGSFTTFYEMVWLVIARPRQLAAEMWESGRLSVREAKLFRWICIFHALVPLWVMWAWAVSRWWTQSTGVLVAGGALALLWLWRATGWLPKLMRRQTMSAERHRRAYALAQYTAAPLVLAPICLLLSMAALAAWRAAGGAKGASASLVIFACAVVAAAYVLSWAYACMAFLYNTMKTNAAELTAWGTMLLVSWFIQGLIILVGAPVAIAWLMAKLP